MSFRTGSIVWVEDKDQAWVEGEVGDITNDNAVVETAQGKKVISPVVKLLRRDPEADHGGVDDMTKLIYLNEPGVLYNLSRRYALNEIYTYTGSILIAVNPFIKLPHLYNEHMMDQYKGVHFGELSPHVFAIADATYRAMMNQARNQSILVSGESGSGKTETTKLIMQYLTYVGGRTFGDDRSVEQQVLESNPLLEAFGNARTVKNDNSSRFGKFVEIQFDGSGRISGAAIRTYLLERSRVVQITDPERNYHCFYQLCASGKDSEKYKLGHPSNFHYLNQSKTYELDGRDSAHEYLKTKRAMDIVGINLDDQEAIFRTLAAILHLGNIEFSPGKEHDSSSIKDESSKFHLQMAANLFKCDENILLSTLCFRSIRTCDGSIMKALDCAAATASRDTLAKTVYARIFDWLVENVNRSVGQDKSSRLRIGLLDIYGFECFKNNSFEQFCINFANEKLQQHFNQHVFKMEQEEYTNEQINWSYIDFIDNQDVLDLIEKKPIGIISLLDEACMLPKATHETFSMKLFQSFSTHPRLEKAKFSKTDFTLSHYAGKVPYQTLSFVDKNRDYVVAEHQNLLSSSRCLFISKLFSSVSEEPFRSSYKFSSVASRFKQQLQALMETLNSTEPHYVRCIKPNSTNCPQKFENKSVLHQLRCGGVLEAVRISLSGYPTRRTYSEFIDRFGILDPKHTDHRIDEKALTERVIKKLQLKNFQLGKTKVFLRAGQIAVLDARRNEILDKSTRLIQCFYRSYVARRRFVMRRRAAVKLQAIFRGYWERGIYKMRKESTAATLVQKYLRTWILRRTFLHLYSVVLHIQSCIRRFYAMQTLLHMKEQKAAVTIQAHWRMFTACLQIQKYRNSAISIQCSWRRKLASRELRRLKLAANEAGALREAKNKLEIELEDLKLRLTLEKRLRVASEESKTVEISNMQNILEAQNAGVNSMKLAYRDEQNKNKSLQEQLDLVLKENKDLHVRLAKMEELEKKNLVLKNTLESLTESNLEMEQELLNTRKYSHDTVDKLQDAEIKFLRLQQYLHNLEEKLVSLDDENQILRQKALSLSPRNSLAGALKSIPENHSVGSVLSSTNQWPTPESPTTKLLHFLPRRLSDLRISRMVIERHEEYLQLLQKCIKEDLGFRGGKPVAACIIYKCLLHWHAFEAEKTDIFDYLIEAINNAFKADNENDILPYWLSNASAFLCLLQRNLRSNGFFISHYRQSAGSLNLSGRIGQSPKSPKMLIEVGQNLSFVDARYPAMLFKQQLNACLEKIFGLIRDNLKKEISPLLSLCIQAPKSTRGSAGRTLKSPGGTITQQPLSNHWDRIIKFLDSLKDRLQKNYVPSFFIRKLITQVFSFINIQLFNSLLLRRECCTFSNGEYVKSGLSVLEKWIVDATEEFAGTSWRELKFIRQAVEFLVIPQKRKMSLDEITQVLCPALSVRQIYRICTMYWDDKYSTHSVSNEVVATIRDMVNNDSQNLASNSFLLDDDLSIPFTTEDISQAIPVIDPSDIQLPSSLHNLPAALFLLQSEAPPA